MQCGDLLRRPKRQAVKQSSYICPKRFRWQQHMLMMDRNNLKIADRIIGWLRENAK
jgi:hypothetical protein